MRYTMDTFCGVPGVRTCGVAGGLSPPPPVAPVAMPVTGRGTARHQSAG